MFREQDDFEAIIDKYKLWDDPNFYRAAPSSIDTEEIYCQALNECPPDDFKVPDGWRNGYAEALKEHDPVAYRCGLADYDDVMAESYFRGPGDEFYQPEGVREAINAALANKVESLRERIEKIEGGFL